LLGRGVGGYGGKVLNVRGEGVVKCGNRGTWYKKKLAPISNLKMFTIQRKKSWYVVLKKLAPISNLKMFTIQRKKSWYVVLKKASTNL